MRIQLLWLTTSALEAEPLWPLGPTLSIADNVRAIDEALSGDTFGHSPSPNATDFMLFWHASLGPPAADSAERIVHEPGELWHGGLCLGQTGRPELMDFVHPTWMLQRDPATDRIASSWRLSLRACLMPVKLWTQLGGLHPAFDELDIASLELGHRLWRNGVLMRHTPELLSACRLPAPPPEPSLEDELRFLRLTAGKFWCAWAAMRAAATHGHPRLKLWRAWRRARRLSPVPTTDPAPNESQPDPESMLDPELTAGPAPSVAVLIPTLDRYPYLTVVLEQLRHQTVAPSEIVVIDQTAVQRRHREWRQHFADLPLRVLEQDRPGQSTARNAGLRTLTADFVLFLDDDVEIETDLIARHLAVLARFRADASCGVTSEAGAGPLPKDFRRRRLSDVFPTCNAMARRQALQGSGLFDLAFDHGSRADADLGTRIYLSGGLMVLEPTISVFHHKAPAGGLRQHGARVVTYADSRRRLSARHLPSSTEIYLARRYFSPRQVREALLLRSVGTFKGSGGTMRQLAKLVIGLLQWPSTRAQIRRAQDAADKLEQRYPEIPPLPMDHHTNGEIP